MKNRFFRVRRLVSVWVVSMGVAFTSVAPAFSQNQTSNQPSAPEAAPTSAARTPGSNYTLGPNDQITLSVAELQENFDGKTFRIDQHGDVSIPLVGRVHAGGLTTMELEDLLKVRFSSILKAPDVVVGLTESSSQPVSVLGAVNTPGIRQLQGHKTLFEVLSLSGGMKPEAGTMVTVTRDPQWAPLTAPGATINSAGQSVASYHLNSIMRGSEDNIAIMPGDTVFVPKADLVYAVGSLIKPGGFPIGENEMLSALQVVSLSEGLTKTAASDRAKILRVVPGQDTRAEIPIDLKSLMAGKSPDTILKPDDILFVPESGAKAIRYRTMEAIITAATGMAVYGRY